MESAIDETRAPIFGDRPSSDVVVRLRTQEGRDDWLYCHSEILRAKSKYFDDRLSENWPTVQILDSRHCVEVYCQESDVDCHVNLIRLFYVKKSDLSDDMRLGIRNALGILRVAVELSCPLIVFACISYIEAVPWEESEEEEILKSIPRMGPQAEPILARLQPVNPIAVRRVFVSAIRFATSSPPLPMKDIKSTAQEQLEYMLTEDDDAPILTADDEIRAEVKDCVQKLLFRFSHVIEASISDMESSATSKGGKMQLFLSHLLDLAWACQILIKLDLIKDFVIKWMELSEQMLHAVKQTSLQSAPEYTEISFKVAEIASKVLEPIGYGTVILPTAQRLHMVKLWLPFIRITKPLLDSSSACVEEENSEAFHVDDELWQTLESAFVSIILALPSEYQAEILTEWLANEHVHYPDLTEAFEVWCYRTKVTRRKLTAVGEINSNISSKH
uniref:BTB domain-containing protein n=1 Tax=Kalanchoe fedtschenkoi TaxID=63787 RepID=A0A7N0V6G6_KALFE